MATKSVNKWKQTERDKNEADDIQQKQKQAAEKITSTTAKGPETSATTVGSGDKLLRRGSHSLDSETAEGMSTGSNSNPKLIGSDKTASAQIRGRTGTTATVSSHQQQLGAQTGSMGNNGASKQATGETDGRPKVVAKAKAKISRPRLTGLEDEQPATSKTAAGKQRSGSSSKPTTTSTSPTSSSVTSPINVSPLSKIMAAAAKFQEQAKRKPVDNLVFSDNFMDSLSAADNVKPKKAKIVRKKLNPSVVMGMGTTTAGVVPVGASKSASSDTTAAAETSTGSVKRRVRFCDEVDRQLVEERTFEIEEGERINVTKMDKETLKHLDSQREKQFLLDARQHGFGMAAAGGGGDQPAGSSFSSPTDPSPMPPAGHGRPFEGTTQTASSTPQFGQKRVPETLFPWKLHVVEFQSAFTVVPGSQSEAKLIEMERQRTNLPALVLPNSQPLPISELSDEDVRRQREEGFEHVPKIIPLESIPDVVEPGNGALLNKEKPMEEDQQEPKPVFEEKMEEDDRCESPVAPSVHRLSSGSSSEDEADSETENKPNMEAKQEELAIAASPQPEPSADESAQQDSSTDSIEVIPTEQIRSSKEDEHQRDMRHISVADSSLGQIHQQKQAAGSSQNVPTPSGTAPAAFRELIRTNPNLGSLLSNLKHTLGPGGGNTSASAEALDTSGKSPTLASMMTITTPVGLSLSGLSMAQTPVRIPPTTGINIPPPPTHLYPHRPPIGHPPTTTSPRLLTPQQITTPHILQQQMLLMSGQRTPIVGGTPLRAGIPLPDFTKPPPNFGRFPPPPTATMGLPPIGPAGQKPPTLPGGATTQASNLPQLKPGTPQKDETSSAQTTPTAAGKLISPGAPAGFDKGGLPPSTAEQQTPAGQGVPQIPQPVQSPCQPTQAMSFPQQQSPPQQPPIVSVAEARKMVGECAFFMHTKTCDYGDKCKFAHDEGTLTMGIQMAMRGVNIATRGGVGFRGARGGRGGFGPSGRGGPAGSSSLEDRQPRRRGATGGRGGRDYGLSPIRDGSGGRGGSSFRDRAGRRFRSSSTRRRRRYSRSRSRSRDRYSRRRRSRSSRDRDRGSGRERRSKSRSSSNSSSTCSRSPTPRRQRDEQKESSSGRDLRERRRRNPAERREQRQQQQRYRPRSKSPAARRRSSSSSSNTSNGHKRVENASANSNGNLVADIGAVESQPEPEQQGQAAVSEKQPTGETPQPAPQPVEKPVIEVITID